MPSGIGCGWFCPVRARELALDNCEDALDQRASSVLLAQKILAHQTAHACAAAAGEALGRDDAIGLQSLTAKDVVRSESNSASASTQPTGVCRCAGLTRMGSVAQSFHGACRAL
jgi:hypothetical protein